MGPDIRRQYDGGFVQVRDDDNVSHAMRLAIHTYACHADVWLGKDQVRNLILDLTSWLNG